MYAFSGSRCKSIPLYTRKTQNPNDMIAQVRARLTFFLIFFLFAGISFGQTRFSEQLTSAAGFGGAIAIGAQGVFIGSAPVGWQTGNEPPGTVFLYTQNSDGYWVESAGIKANDGIVGDDFGRSVFLQGGMLIVGAPGATAALRASCL